MLRVDAPEAINGGVLQDELAAAGLDTEPIVSGVWLLLSGLSEGDRAKAEQVVADHVPPEPGEPEPTAQDFLEAIRELAAEGAEVESRISERANIKAHERAGR